MAGEAASAASAMADSSASMISALGALLKYGAPGLALAIMIVCFFSLHSLQKHALQGKVSAERVAPFERLQKLYLMASVLVFCISTIAPKMLDYFLDKPVVNGTHRLAFNISPTSFEREDLAPKVVVAGIGQRITFLNGTAQDTISGDKTYQLDVDKLVREIDAARFLALQTQLRQPPASGGLDALSNR